MLPSLTVISFTCRFFCVIGALIALILTATAPGARCRISDKYAVDNCTVDPLTREHLRISQWLDDGWEKHFPGKGSRIRGQIFVIITEILLIILHLSLVAMDTAKFYIRRPMLVITLGLAALLSIVSAMLEGWYATGFDTLDKSISFGVWEQYLIIGWAIASCLLYVIGAMSIIDAVCLAMRKNREPEADMNYKQFS